MGIGGGGDAVLATTPRRWTAVGGIERATGAAPLNAARDGAILASGSTRAAAMALAGSAMAASRTCRELANAAGATAVTALGARMFTYLTLLTLTLL
jgi:hypothetical protein